VPNRLLQWLAVARHCGGSEDSVRATTTTEHRVMTTTNTGADGFWTFAAASRPATPGATDFAAARQSAVATSSSSCCS
jgi:hypothetical protein